ncbi:MAG: hypothetical protein ACXWIU_11885, partial [Limisphaerales bacterium]
MVTTPNGFAFISIHAGKVPASSRHGQCLKPTLEPGVFGRSQHGTARFNNLVAILEQVPSSPEFHAVIKSWLDLSS